MERKPACKQDAANTDLQHTREAIKEYCGAHETNETIWKSIQKRVLRTRVRQFLYKTMHEVYIIEVSWRHIPGFKQRQTCTICNVEDNMEHILLECTTPMRQKVWDLARQMWPHAHHLWPNVNLGIILGIGCLSLPKDPTTRDNQNQHHSPKNRAIL